MKGIILFSLCICTFAANLPLKFLNQPSDGCWLKAYGRGAGRPIHTCHTGEEQNGLLCYPVCNNDFYGVGPVCWQNCPNNYRDDGAFCYKPPSYGRGAGYTSEGSCLNENKQGCEKNGLLWYPKCQEGFHAVGCCVCSPDCLKDQTDIGISCAKQSYGRGAGSPLTCTDKSEEYYAGVCYSPCSNTFNGIGPVCWGNCPAGYNPCGALCLKTETCADDIYQTMNDVIKIITDFAAQDITGGIIDVGKFIEDFVYPICQDS